MTSDLSASDARRVNRIRHPVSGDSLRRGDGPAPDKDAKLSKEVTLEGIKKVQAPLQGRANRLLPSGRVVHVRSGQG